MGVGYRDADDQVQVVDKVSIAGAILGGGLLPD